MKIYFLSIYNHWGFIFPNTNSSLNRVKFEDDSLDLNSAILKHIKYALIFRNLKLRFLLILFPVKCFQINSQITILWTIQSVYW
jgi:hypothetical protein